MRDSVTHSIPLLYPQIKDKCTEIEFSMLSDMQLGSLLKSLVASKPEGRFLELGTGIGLALSWMLDGMDTTSRVVSIDNDASLIEIAKGYFEDDTRVELICQDGGEWLRNYNGPQFDLIFADAWPGKFFDLDVTLDHVKEGGIYIIDDMSEQSDWPEGHDQKVINLIEELEQKQNFTMVKLNWSTGIIIMTKQKAQRDLN